MSCREPRRFGSLWKTSKDRDWSTVFKPGTRRYKRIYATRKRHGSSPLRGWLVEAMKKDPITLACSLSHTEDKPWPNRDAGNSKGVPCIKFWELFPLKPDEENIEHSLRLERRKRGIRMRIGFFSGKTIPLRNQLLGHVVNINNVDGTETL